MEILLQPLRIPSGWLVSYNKFYQVEPGDELGEDAWMWFSQDLLQLVNQRWGRLLDLGWYPDGDVANGSFRIEMYVGDCTGKLLYYFSNRLRPIIVNEIERLLIEASAGRL